MSKNNLGEAILILGILFILVNYEVNWWGIIGMIFLIGVAISTWKMVTRPQELKDLVIAQTNEIQTRNLMVAAQTKLFMAQALHYAGMKQS